MMHPNLIRNPEAIKTGSGAGNRAHARNAQARDLLSSGLYRRLRNCTGSCPSLRLAGCTADRELQLVLRATHPAPNVAPWKTDAPVAMKRSAIDMTVFAWPARLLSLKLIGKIGSRVMRTGENLGVQHPPIGND